MALTKKQLDSLDKLLVSKPLIKKNDPALTETMRGAIAKLTPGIIEWERAQMGGGLGPRADMADAVVSAVVTAVIDTIVIVVVAKPSELGPEVEKMSEANIRAIAKDRISRASVGKINY